MRFHDPAILIPLILLVPLAMLYRLRERSRPALPVSGSVRPEALPETLRTRLARLLPYLRLPVLALAIIALARPQAVVRESKVRSVGADLVVAFDLSTSMLAEDLGRQGKGRGGSRLAMAKEVLREFIRGRRGDRLGLVAFAARPYPAAPLTIDHDWLRQAIDRLDVGSIEDGTALGDVVLAALNRLRDRPAKSRAVILVTDGRNNAGAASPQLAAATARTLGIRVHAVGIGSRGPAVIPVASPLGGTSYRQVDADMDEATLREIAAITGGGYFRADDPGALARVFKEIDRLEKSPLEEKVFFSFRELYRPLLMAALALLLTEWSLRHTWLRRLP